MEKGLKAKLADNRFWLAVAITAILGINTNWPYPSLQFEITKEGHWGIVERISLAKPSRYKFLNVNQYYYTHPRDLALICGENKRYCIEPYPEGFCTIHVNKPLLKVPAYFGCIFNRF